MNAKRLTPILNVSNIRSSFGWFERLGWSKGFEWGDPPTFGSVCSGDCEIFLCEGAQGGRGRGADWKPGLETEELGDKGVWMSIWVDNVDEVHRHCVAEGLDITWPPTDEPWGVREMHLRHPDGHVFRISQGSES